MERAWGYDCPWPRSRRAARGLHAVLLSDMSDDRRAHALPMDRIVLRIICSHGMWPPDVFAVDPKVDPAETLSPVYE